MPLVFNPFRQSRRLVTRSIVVLMMTVVVMVFPFRVLRAAVLTQPPITEIEEMGGLVHRPKVYRRESGDSDKRTGTVIRRPLRQMFTCTVSPI